MWMSLDTRGSMKSGIPVSLYSVYNCLGEGSSEKNCCRTWQPEQKLFSESSEQFLSVDGVTSLVYWNWHSQAKIHILKTVGYKLRVSRKTAQRTHKLQIITFFLSLCSSSVNVKTGGLCFLSWLDLGLLLTAASFTSCWPSLWPATRVSNQ